MPKGNTSSRKGVGCAMRRVRAYMRERVLLRKPKGPVAAPWNPRPGRMPLDPKYADVVQWCVFVMSRQVS